MAHLLDGCWAKIERASESITNLESEIQRWAQSDPPPHRIVRGLNHKKRAYTFTAFCSPVPLRISVLAGEIVHHLRSSLDHLIWALAIKRHTNPSFRIQFPISTTSEKYLKAQKDGIMKGISKKACDIVESLQPFKRKNPSDDPLLILEEFSNTDKHKLLLVVTNVVTMGDKISVDSGETDANQTSIIGMSPPPETLGLTATEGGTEVFSILLGNYTPRFSATLHFTLQLSLEKFGNKKNVAIVSGLAQLRDAAKSTIERFRGEF